MHTAPDYEFAIIGAGFAGLGMGIRLKMAGRDSFVILERAGELGGTWRDNVYPGCACDIPSVVYSFSFDQNPEWSRKYPSQPEILAYLKACAARFNIYSHIRFQADVHRLAFDEARALWEVETRDGQIITARYVISAMGPLNRPNIPDIPGLERFEGARFHSSAWDTAFDPAGMRIASVGTGASAIQYVPRLAQEAETLYVFQRTPPWIVPREDEPVSPLVRALFRRLPPLQNLYRALVYWQLEIQVLGFLGHDRFNAVARRVALDHLYNQVADRKLRSQLTPGYDPGCKRILVSDDYYPALQRENVELVTGTIREIRPGSVVGEDGVNRPVDALIFGTGFVASEFLLDMTIRGLDGRELLSEWRDTGPEAYMGISVSGYPNLFFLLGPNTGLGHNSVLLMIESQYNYIFDYLRQVEDQDIPYLDVRPGAQAAFNADVQKRLADTVWQSGGCRSWYQTGSGKNTTLWPGSTVGYRLRTFRVDGDAFAPPMGGAASEVSIAGK